MSFLSFNKILDYNKTVLESYLSQFTAATTSSELKQPDKLVTGLESDHKAIITNYDIACHRVMQLVPCASWNRDVENGKQ